MEILFCLLLVVLKRWMNSLWVLGTVLTGRIGTEQTLLLFSKKCSLVGRDGHTVYVCGVKC